MSCSTVRGILYNYISAYVDNELSATDRKAVEKHFEICAHCANEKFQIEQMKDTLQSEFAFSTPYGLKEDIRDRLSESIEPDVQNKKNFLPWRWIAHVLPPLITAVATILIIFALLPNFQQSKNMEEEIVSAHIRSLIEDNLTHVESSKPEMIKSWFVSKIEFAANAKDLIGDGYELQGARLDYVNKQNAASVVYITDNHIINLFIFPTGEQNMLKPKTFQNRGYNIVKWTKHGLEYCAISDINLNDLKRFTDLYRAES